MKIISILLPFLEYINSKNINTKVTIKLKTSTFKSGCFMEGIKFTGKANKYEPIKNIKNL
ncbi:hypothetical protein TMU01_16630 [Tenuibacillus multivorans]|nr:hypothetical protein TMU01_16630 [Tenuibacillus multivorans]